MKLTQEQKERLIASSFCFRQAKEILADIATKVSTSDIDDLIDEAFAAGKAVGAAEMRERCAKVAETTRYNTVMFTTDGETHIGDMTAIEAGKAIRALKATL